MRAEITPPGQTPGEPKDVAGRDAEITTAETRTYFVRAQGPSVGLSGGHTILSANGPTASVIFGTNNCPSQTLASTIGRSLQSVSGGHMGL